MSLAEWSVSPFYRILCEVHSSVGKLRRQLLAFAFVDEFGPIYAVYPLWFADGGLSTQSISLIFVVWALVGLVLEVPSGALADRFDRRRLIAIALVLRALGIGTWMIWHDFSGILLGAILWSTHSALASGAWEALVYDELQHHQATDTYPVVMARLGQANHTGIALGTLLSLLLLAIPLDMRLIGWTTVALHIPSLVLLLTLPRSQVAEKIDASFSDWISTLRSGVRAVMSTPSIAKLVALGCILEGLFILDEYVHLLGRHRGAPDVMIPVLVGTVWIGLLIGGEIAARFPSLSPKTLALLMSLSALVAVGGLATQTVWGISGIAIMYAALNVTWVLSDARFQAQIPSSLRATVTSVRALFSALVSMLALGLVGVLARDDDPSPGLFLLISVLFFSGLLVRRWVPKTGNDSVSGR